jgi:hypothetical protein
MECKSPESWFHKRWPACTTHVGSIVITLSAAVCNIISNFFKEGENDLCKIQTSVIADSNEFEESLKRSYSFSRDIANNDCKLVCVRDIWRRIHRYGVVFCSRNIFYNDVENCLSNHGNEFFASG